MPEINTDITLQIEVLNPQRQPLGGTVDVEAKPKETGQAVTVKGADASKIIDVGGLLRGPRAVYDVTVTPTDVAKPVSQTVTIPASGAAKMEFVIDKGIITPPPNPTQYNVHGNLVFDNGLPAAGIVMRLYSVGFAGQDIKLGETKADAQGNYSLTYTLATPAPASVVVSPASAAPNIQVRILDATNKEITISNTKFNAQPSETLNLIVPTSAQPLAPEFQRLADDMKKSIGGVANLSQAQEGAVRQDLTLLNQSTNWDARVVALAATAGQLATTTGLGQDVLYSLFRIGLPTDPSLLAMVPSDAVQQALTKASQSGIVSMNGQQISAATTAFQNFASKAQLAIVTPGAVSSFKDLLSATLPDTTQQAAFASLYFSNPDSDDIWTQAASLKIPAQTLDALKLQGKFLYLTFNNAPLAQKLQQDVGSLTNISQVAEKDYYLSATWQSTLTALAANGGDQALQNLIPATYPGQTTADRLAAYAGDLARKVKMSFPNQVAARMIDNKQIVLGEKTAPNVSSFLRAAAPLGYSLGRTPLNTFLSNSAGKIPMLDADSVADLKTLHRLYQITPSSESLQAAMQSKFTSAHDIAAYTKEDFLNKYASVFPAGEGEWVYGRAQTVKSVTFNIFSSAKQLDSTPPVYAFSGSSDARQQAKNSLVEQFPSMASLFGNLDYCQCDDCRSVLSPAAYFVDVLEFLNGPAVAPAVNAAGYTPLDVLIGKDATVPGRRPDLGALPLTCENTNTEMPYIDLVNEILEYYIANNNKLDASLAYDTGSATTADLTAEPQNILPQVYNTTLKNAVFPLGLPFDLWIATVRGFLNYLNSPLSQVLDTLRPVDNLELLTNAVNPSPYYRAQILAEALGCSPSEYAVLTDTDATLLPLTTNWFKLYGYASEAIALNGQPNALDPTEFDIPPLSSAKNLAQLLGLTYQELTDLVMTGFLNPKLYPLIFQFQRFGINMDDVFAYTNQPGFPTFSTTKADFESVLNGITSEYKTHNPTFDAITWLKNLLPANYTQKVLVLFDPNTGCNFGGTTLLYADNSATSAATPLDFVKFNLFVRLWKKLGWTMDEVDRALQLFFPATLPAWGAAGFDAAFAAAWKTALVYFAHLDDLNTRLAPAMGRTALLPLWSNLPAQGVDPLYAQLFLTSSVSNNDWAFDDPSGVFPSPPADFPAPPPFPPLTTFSAHQAVVQGVLGLTADEITAIFTDAGAAVTTVSFVQSGQTITMPGFTLTNLSICYRYSALAKCLQMEVSDMISLKVMSGLDPFQAVSGVPLAVLAVLADDVLLNQTLLFVKQVGVVQNSGFSVEDLNYLLLQKFDPVGKYQTDTNALIALMQAVATGLQQVQAQNAVPANIASLAESLIDQTLSGLFPAAILKTLFTLLTNSQTYNGQGTFAAAIDPTPFAGEAELTFSYDSTTTTETIGVLGYLTDWKKTELEGLNAAISGMLGQAQQNAQNALAQSVAAILGVWASLTQYEAIKIGLPAAIPPAPLIQADPAVSLSYDQADQLQWLGYRGVLTDVKKSVLETVNASPDLAKLLTDVQSQALPAYSQLVGSILAMWTNVQTYQATQVAVLPADQIDANAFFVALTAAQQAGTITGPVPQLQFSYDATSKIQTLTCQGVLPDAMRNQLSLLAPASTVRTNLLQAVRAQTVNLFQTLATNLLTVAATDLDNYAQPFLGLDVSKQQKQVKVELISAFLPLLSQKLARQLVLQTLSANLGADPSLVEALTTDAALLTDPSNPGKSLLGAFLALQQQGLSGSYYTSTDGTGAPQATGTAATVDTADPTNNKPGTASAHFEGYLQVPTDGPYRFFAELGNTGAYALLQMDAPDPTALLSNPIIPSISKATKDHDEVSQFVQLKGGLLYHFTVDFSSLGANGASLLIQGESLPKGALNQVVLYPEQAMVGFTRAKILLAKTLQILQVTGLGEREISYMVANSSQFSNLRLSSLPTDSSLSSAVALSTAISLFSQFLTLADYADLRKGPAGGTDGLIDVFQTVGETFTESVSSQDANKNSATPWTSFANLTRRDAATVRAIGEYFGLIQDVVAGANRQVTAVNDFGNNKGIRRIWQALQLQQIVGIPISTLIASTAIASVAPVSPDLIADGFKNAVKAQYTIDQWRPIAQSVFDGLRKSKRDALVTYLVNVLGLENANQLFEYFLVDPGMQPVVLTSRLRLAMSSAQTFVQRCLLNLENGNSNPAVNVAPNVIDADTWEWMKRYRVWEANREIFLFPENWMEPELRLDKTDLFESLESTLLQGDVTSDLADDAFFAYLQGLEVRARLDIVAMYLDQNLSDGSASILHVLGRTYGHPHKYFYRTYSAGTWSGWIAVTPDIEGNHITLAIWKGRLNIFWVTFISQQQPPSGASSGTIGAASGLSLDQLASGVSKAQAIPQVQVQLHWIDYFQGKWTNRISTDIGPSGPTVRVNPAFDPASVYIHVSKEADSNGNEGAVRIHLDFPPVMGPRTFTLGNIGAVDTLSGRLSTIAAFSGAEIVLGGTLVRVGGGGNAFRVTSKNCAPDFGPQYWQPAPFNPYNTDGISATLYTGSGNLKSTFENNVKADGSGTSDTEDILDTVTDFAVLNCANTVVPSPFLDSTEPLYQQAGGLVSPFFFKDTSNQNATVSNFADELTFFVQPSLTETTIEEWNGWAISPQIPQQNWNETNLFSNINVVSQVPVAGPAPVNPGDPVYSIYAMQDTADWLTAPTTVVSFGNSLIGQSGGIAIAGAAANSASITPSLTASMTAAGLRIVGKQGLTLGKGQSAGTANTALLGALASNNRRTF